MKKTCVFLLSIALLFLCAGCGLLQTVFKRGDSNGNTVYAVFKAKDTGISDLQKELDSSRTVLLRRLEAQGITSGKVTVVNEDSLRVELPSVKDMDMLIQIVSNSPRLVFLDSEGKVILTGANIILASQGTNQNGEFVVNFQFDEEGTKMFAEATERLVGQQISISLDNTIISTPTVNAPITEGSAYIEGGFNASEAQELAVQLTNGALPLEFELSETGDIR